MPSGNKDKDLLDIIDTFTIRELIEVLRACGFSKRPTKEKCNDAVKALLKKNATMRQTAIDKIMKISEQAFDKSDKELMAAKAKQITDDLDPSNPPVDFDDESRMRKPDYDGMRLFERILKVACNHKLNPIIDKRILVGAWESLDNDQLKWNQAVNRLREVYREYVDNGGDIADDRVWQRTITAAFFCPFCYTVRKKFVRHLRLHFPKHAVSEPIATEMDELCAMIKKNNGYANKVHKLVMDFWKMIHSDSKSKKELKLFNEVKGLYEKMMKGRAEHKLYFLLQLIHGYELISMDKLLQAIIKYNGKAAEAVRHFGSFKSQGVSGNVAREIAKIVNIHNARGNNEILEMNRLYVWNPLKVPNKSADVLEHAFTLALWHLTERNSAYWNMQITSIKADNKFADIHPETLILVGMYALWQITQNFSEQTIKEESGELLAIYDNFTHEQRKSFDKKYGIDKSDDRDVQIALLTKALQDIQVTTKAHGDDRYGLILANPQLQALLNPIIQDGDIDETGDLEDGASDNE